MKVPSVAAATAPSDQCAETPLALLTPVRVAPARGSEGFYSVDACRRCTFISDAAAAMLGGTPADFLGRDMVLVHHQGSHDAPTDDGSCPIVEAMRRNEHRQVANDLLYRLDGSSFAVDYSVHPIVDAGRVTGAVVTFSDRAARQRATAELRRAEAIMQVALNSGRQAMVVIGLDERVQAFNQPASQIMSAVLNRALRVGAPMTDYIQPELRPVFHTNLCAALRGETVRVERRLDAPGSSHWIELHYNPVRDEHGAAIGVCLTALPIDDRKRAEERARFLADASAAFAASLDYATTLERVARATVPYLCDWCVVWAVEHDRIVGTAALAHREPELEPLVEVVAAGTIPALNRPGSALVTIREREQPIVVHDVSDDQLIASAATPEVLAAMRRLAPRSCIFAPLLARGELLGFMCLSVRGDRPRYDEHDRAIVEDLASRAAMALANATLYQQAQAEAERNERHLARARALATAGRVFAEVSLDYHAALDAAAREISLLYGDICIIRVISDDGLWLNPVAFYHPDPAMRAYFAERASITPYRMNEGLLGKAAVNGETVLINDWPHNAPAYAIPPNVPVVLEPERFDIQAVMAVPLQAQGRPLGVLSVWRDRPDQPYSEDDLTFLLDLGNRAALAVENGRLYKEMIDRERRYRDILERMSPGRLTPSQPEAGAQALTTREREVLRLLARGLTNQEIASELAVSRSTAKAHVEHIIAKLGVASRTEAAVRATELGLISPRTRGQ